MVTVSQGGQGASAPAPTVNDFGTIGVIGVNQANLAKVNQALAKLPASQHASPAAIQAVINQVNQQITAVSNISSTGASKATVNDFAALGATAVTANNLAAVQAASAVIAPVVSTNGATTTITFQPTLKVALPKNATGYQLLVNGKVVATSTGNTVSTNAVIKRSDVMTVVATGNDGTLSSPIPVKVSTTSAYVGSVIYTGKTATLASSGKNFLDAVVSSALKSGLATITLNQFIKSGLSSSLSQKQLNSVAQYISTASKGKLKLKVVKAGVSNSSSIDLVIG